ncbi:MAG: response regulator transcription factor [Epsilonproteobacteria bacterium]|nr:response regulator transcription factor [Campylobacterota bacterium]OIO16186.1 MAG: regulator [Helicobacteraceae bacterium CG1_02_36_14]PIP09351.1 MAG: DNA-binding response regulator [Sulfurimonas sp. CG23_combo_of_CG06-09_8_20_14_all_36_33]PIS24404.1 MAG: DNA-binding response regulator [Sulfurimonas sp. CG08_land_8_20_14_0_20_36_33]PIU33745.1 MAG: DNA-binding response regulator [Sulfurimonas sp. CG07_land_8_20_14_0_80_36_56]PIV03120.1 MAG: DNA-binding response regulator [Sulfurimonas sp. C
MSKKILLLEDDTLLLQTLQELLESEGYAVTSVACGNDAIDASYEDSFDLYVFDINVPDMNGLELLESLRNADDNTPAIFISALIDLQSISKAFEIGAEDYLKKPFFPEELLLRVNAKLSRKSVAIRYRDLEFDSITKTLRKEGKVVALGEVQEQLFELFITNISKVLDKEILMECLEKPSPEALRVALTKLKQTTGLEIKNLRGIGYILEQS